MVSVNRIPKLTSLVPGEKLQISSINRSVSFLPFVFYFSPLAFKHIYFLFKLLVLLYTFFNIREIWKDVSSFILQLVSAPCVPSTLLSNNDRAVVRTDMLCHHGIDVLVSRTDKSHEEKRYLPLVLMLLRKEIKQDDMTLIEESFFR